jgi:hypothetical protein
MKDCRNVNAGNYTIVEFHAGQRPKVQCAYLPYHYPDWIQAEGQRWKGIRWLPEEEKWTNPNDPPLPQYSIMSREQLESLRAKN